MSARKTTDVGATNILNAVEQTAEFIQESWRRFFFVFLIIAAGYYDSQTTSKDEYLYFNWVKLKAVYYLTGQSALNQYPLFSSSNDPFFYQPPGEVGHYTTQKYFLDNPNIQDTVKHNAWITFIGIQWATFGVFLLFCTMVVTKAWRVSRRELTQKRKKALALLEQIKRYAQKGEGAVMVNTQSLSIEILKPQKPVEPPPKKTEKIPVRGATWRRDNDPLFGKFVERSMDTTEN